jgi:antibiotic biosynthesis monooxygenase
MYAQIVESRLTSEQLEELEVLVRCELLPTLRAESGFCGAVSLVERERGAVLLVLLWETEEEATGRRAAPAGTSSALTDVLGAHSETIWEVNARG